MASGVVSSGGIVPLNSSNYPTWKTQCKMTLIKDNLWSIVGGTETLPDTNEGNAQTNFNRRKDKALAVIVLAVNPSLLYLLNDPVCPCAVWKKLEDQFQPKTWANKLHLRRKLYSLRLTPGTSVQEHCKRMIEMFNELAVLGDPVSEEDRVVHLLASLPESFNMLVTALEANKDVPEMETVIERLMHEERKQTEQCESGAEAGLFVKKKGQKSKAQGPMCFKCKGFGHIKKNCPSVKKDKSNKKEKAQKAEENISFLAEETALTSKTVPDITKWIIDSGATSHMCHDKQSFVNLKSLHPPVKVSIGDGRVLEAHGKGSVHLSVVVSNDGNTRNCHLQDVLHVPDLDYNLVSVSKAGKAGKVSRFDGKHCEIMTEDGVIVATGVCEGSLYCLALEEEHVNIAADIWHKRYGHLSQQSLEKLKERNMVTGMNFAPSKLSFCNACAEGKSSRSKFPTSDNKRHDSVLGIVHSDVCGKISPRSLGGAEYFVTFIDDHSRYVWIYFMKTKDEVFDKFLEWKLLVEKQYGQKVKVLRTDNGGEYKSGKFKAFLKKEGIRHEFTVPKTPEQNGLAERMNRTLVEMVRSTLYNMRKDFWAEALSTAAYIRNRSPTSAIPDMTPYEALNGKKPDVSHLKPFACPCYAHIPKDERKKLYSKARKCLFLGYGDCVKGYRVFDEQQGKVILSRDVRFDENESRVTDDISHEDEPSDDDEPVETVSANEQSEKEDPIPVRRSQRERKSPDRYGEWVTVAQDCESPRSYSEAMLHPTKSRWQSAMEDEMKSLKSNDVWDLVPLPDGRKAVGSKWVYKVKVSADGTVERYKARLVAQGFSQKYGLDYDETFCPVVRGETVRTILALCAQKELMIHQMDVATAFLNGTLEEEVYMKQPDGFVENPDLVCKLKRSLYGLKQSPRCWNTVLDEQLKDIGLVQHKEDPCLYTATGGETVIVAVYVDDILIATESEEKMNQVKQMIASRFNVKDLGKLKSFLGVQVKQEDNGIWIGQPGYAARVLERFGMQESKPVATPVDVSQKLKKDGVSDATVSQTLYQSAVGSLLYLSGWTRPDIAFAVSNVAKFTSNPTQQHWMAVKRILRYISGTIDYGIRYKKGNDQLVGYSDASWANDPNDRKSVSAYIFMLSGAPISWRSKKQTTVALSTAEAEYVALAAAAQEAVWLRNVMKELREKLPATVIHEDNQSAIAIAKNPQFHGRTKHIEIKYHFVRELVDNGTVKLHYCDTSNMLADLLTKGLPTAQHRKLRESLNIM